MRAKTSYFWIGTFVIAGIAMLTVSLVLVSGVRRQREVLLAETLFEESVSGLEVGAPVRFRGVVVGRVTEITVAGALYEETELPYVLVQFDLWGPNPKTFPLERVREAVTTRIAEGLRVRLASTGITGLAYLEADILTDADKYPPKPRDWLGGADFSERIYVPSAPSALTRVVDTLQAALSGIERAKLPDLVKSVRDTLQKIQGAVDDTDLPGLRRQLGDTLAKVSTTIDELDLAGMRGELSTTLDKVGQGADRLVDASSDALQEIRTAAVDVGEVATAAKGLLGDPRIGEVLDGLRTVVAAGHDLLDGRDRQVDTILRNLEQISTQLRNLTTTAERYPSWLLFGQPPPNSPHR